MSKATPFSCPVCQAALLAIGPTEDRRVRCPVCGTFLEITVSRDEASDANSTEVKVSVGENENEVTYAVVNPSVEPAWKYSAFISYRHVDPDRQWAKWLHARLETFRTPQDLVRSRGVAHRLAPVFRDFDELPASSQLHLEIEEALRRSAHLIVICSQSTPQSKWVNREIELFRQLGRSDRILVLLVAGEPGDAFPSALSQTRTLSGESLPAMEPIAADVRQATSVRNSFLSSRRIKHRESIRILARLLGVPFDALVQRDLQRRRRNRNLTLGLTATLLFLFSFLGFRIWTERSRADQEAKLKDLADQQAKQEAKLKDEANQRAQQQTELATQSGARAKAKEQEANASRLLKQREVYIGNMKSAWNAWNRNALAEVAVELSKYDPEHSRDDAVLRGFEWYYMKMLLKVSARNNFNSGSNAVTFAGSVSPDGAHVAAVGHVKNTHYVKIWNLTTGNVVHTLTLGTMKTFMPQLMENSTELQERQELAYNPDGSLVAATCLIFPPGQREGVVKAWNTKSGREVFSATDAGICGKSVIFSPDGDCILAGGYNGATFVWSIRTKKLECVIPAFDPDPRFGKAQKTAIPRPAMPGSGLFAPLTSLVFSPDGKSLTRPIPMHSVRNGRKTASVAWPLVDGGKKEISDEFRASGDEPRADVTATSPDGKWAVTPGYVAGSVRLIKTDTNRKKHPAQDSEDYVPPDIRFNSWPIKHVALSNRHLAMAGVGGLVRIIPLNFPERIPVPPTDLRGRSADISSLAFSQDGERLIAVGDSTVTIWNQLANPEEFVLYQHLYRNERGAGGGIRSGRVSFHPGSKGSISSSLKLSNADDGKVLATFKTNNVIPSAYAGSIETLRATIASDSPAGQIEMFEAGKDTPKLLRGHTKRVNSLIFDQHGQLLVSAGTDQTVRVWDGSKNWEMRLLPGKIGDSTAKAAITRDGRWIIAAGADERPAAGTPAISIWSLASRELQLSIDHDAAIAGWVSSEDGNRIAFADSTGRFAIWDIVEKRLIQEIRGNGRTTDRLAFSRDGTRLLSGNVTFWLIETGEDIISIPIPIGNRPLDEIVPILDRLEEEWKAALENGTSVTDLPQTLRSNRPEEVKPAELQIPAAPARPSRGRRNAGNEAFGDSVRSGSVWKGTKTFDTGPRAGQVLVYELQVIQRTGNDLRGRIYNGGLPAGPIDIEGRVNGDAIKWHEKSGNGAIDVNGKVGRNAIDVHFMEVTKDGSFAGGYGNLKFLTQSIPILPHRSRSDSNLSTDGEEPEFFVRGTIWKGKKTFDKGPRAGQTETYELYLHDVTGDKFRGQKFSTGGNEKGANIEGTIAEDGITWVEHLPSTLNYVSGKIKGNTIELKFNQTLKDGKIASGSGKLVADVTPRVSEVPSPSSFVSPSSATSPQGRTPSNRPSTSIRRAPPSKKDR